MAPCSSAIDLHEWKAAATFVVCMLRIARCTWRASTCIRSASACHFSKAIDNNRFFIRVIAPPPLCAKAACHSAEAFHLPKALARFVFLSFITPWVSFRFSSLIKKKSARNIFDKTPRYITDLGRVQQRSNRPIIAVVKDPRSLALSDFKRSKYSVDQIDEWYEGWVEPKKAYMRSAYLGYQYAWQDDHCFVVRLEDICFDARNTVTAIYDFVGLEFKSLWKHRL